MRHLFYTLWLAIALLSVPQGGHAQGKNLLMVRETFYNYLTPNTSNYDWKDIWTETRGRGLEFAYGRRLFRNGYLVIPAKFGTAAIPNGDDTIRTRTGAIGNLDLLLQLHGQLHEKSFLVPYINFGAGTYYNFTTDDFQFNVPVSLGLNLRLARGIYLNAQTQYRYSVDDLHAWHHGIGFLFAFNMEPPDRDKDGVVDELDKCPDVPGTAATMGCPDRDADGIADADDQCPDQAGPMALQGCPDQDSDGIADKNDACPTEAGTAAFQGCPDTDSDGIADKDDACPREAGPASTKGCPDRDADGIIDREDACPDQKGPLATKGCPDRDADGITDRDDACPDKAGPAAHRGCPDTDNDGIFDDEDRCVTLPGPASNRGCPEIKREDKAKIELAVKAVQFETGKAVLLERSKKVLDDVADVLLRYPYYNLNLSGHTDNVGSDAFNQDLSERRAKTCYDYLIAKGVPASRLTHAGYGETKPKADNKTKAGRDLNRRVEFDLEIK